MKKLTNTYKDLMESWDDVSSDDLDDEEEVLRKDITIEEWNDRLIEYLDEDSGQWIEERIEGWQVSGGSDRTPNTLIWSNGNYYFDVSTSSTLYTDDKGQYIMTRFKTIGNKDGSSLYDNVFVTDLNIDIDTSIQHFKGLFLNRCEQAIKVMKDLRRTNESWEEISSEDLDTEEGEVEIFDVSALIKSLIAHVIPRATIMKYTRTINDNTISWIHNSNSDITATTEIIIKNNEDVIMKCKSYNNGAMYSDISLHIGDVNTNLPYLYNKYLYWFEEWINWVNPSVIK